MKAMRLLALLLHITLTWNLSNSTVKAVKLNVYRSTDSNKTYQQVYTNDVSYFLTDRLSWTDTDVLKDQVYCYQLTAVDSNGNESPFSNVACGIPFD